MFESEIKVIFAYVMCCGKIFRIRFLGKSETFLNTEGTFWFVAYQDLKVLLIIAENLTEPKQTIKFHFC